MARSAEMFWNRTRFPYSERVVEAILKSSKTVVCSRSVVEAILGQPKNVVCSIVLGTLVRKKMLFDKHYYSCFETRSIRSCKQLALHSVVALRRLQKRLHLVDVYAIPHVEHLLGPEAIPNWRLSERSRYISKDDAESLLICAAQCADLAVKCCCCCCCCCCWRRMKSSRKRKTEFYWVYRN